ncbi:MAG: ABC transporter permease [Suipraeoptans sp.]
MTNSLYITLAKSNIKNNRQTYIPYILTTALTVMMYFLISNLTNGPDINHNLKAMLQVGISVMIVFSAIFLFYTNSFLMKRRQKEIGVYNILGMGKRHIAKMLIIETFIQGFISIVLGLIAGILLSRLAHMILKKILHYDINFKYALSIQAIVSTLVLFIAIFAVTLIYNLIQIKLSNPIELLHGSNTGEKEPKTRWLLTITGIIFLGVGYYIAITTKSPLAALSLFFIAVLCVVIGTYELFIAGSITLLKHLKKSKNFYYKTNHFTAL